MTEENNKELTQEDLVHMNMQLEAQLAKERAIAQKLKEQIGKQAAELATFQVGLDQMHEYARTLEKQIAQPQPNAKKGGKIK